MFGAEPRLVYPRDTSTGKSEPQNDEVVYITSAELATLSRAKAVRRKHDLVTGVLLYTGLHDHIDFVHFDCKLGQHVRISSRLQQRPELLPFNILNFDSLPVKKQVELLQLSCEVPLRLFNPSEHL